jgi:hypothetical protein
MRCHSMASPRPSEQAVGFTLPRPRDARPTPGG